MTSNSGKYVIYAEFYGSELYTGRRSKLLFLEGVNPHLDITLASINVLTYNESNTISGTVKAGKNSAVEDKEVTVRIEAPDGTITEETDTSDSNGEFSISYTPTQRGEHRIIAETQEDENYSKSSSQELYVLTDSFETTNTLTSSHAEQIIDNKVKLTSKVRDSNGVDVQGLTVQFYNNTTLLGTAKTNSDGVAVYEYTLGSVGSYSFTAQTISTDMYNTSTSSAVSVTCIKHTLNIQLDNTSIYKGWHGRLVVNDEKGNIVTGLNLTVTVSGNSGTYTSNSAGIIDLGLFNTTGSYTISISGNNMNKYSNVSKTVTLTVKDTPVENNRTLSASNNSTSLPYKTWDNMGNMLTDNGQVANCGTGCPNNVLASFYGSRNTPAPIKFSNLGFNIPDGATIEHVKVTMKIRTLSCSSDSANIRITAPTLTMLSNNVLFQLTTNEGILPYKNFGNITATLDVNNINASQLNNNNTYFLVTFPRNANTNTGRLQIDYVNVEVKYTPRQGG